LAILRPDVQVTLCEPINKKARALADMVQRLELPCVVVASRVQDILGDSRFDVLVARAVGSMGKVLGWLQPHWESVGRLLLIKGPRWVEERHEARQRGRLSGLELRRVRTYRTPLTEAESVILLVRRAS
jgi:16S rRNA (guanine527-N7)-methyltransferase